MTWQEELKKQAQKYHTAGAWVAIILNPIWAIGDYFEIPEYWVQFLMIRIVVALVSLVVLLANKPLKLSPEWLIFIPFLGIAIQNAYMYSVMPVDILQKHTFAYIALFIGAGMLVLWKPIYTISIVVLNIIANIIFFHFDSHLTLGEVLINGGMLTFTVSIFTILLIHTRYNLTKKEIEARLALEESKREIEEQKEIIEHAHEEVKSSINYAERIQQALLDGDESWDRIGTERSILFKPRDVVSGDFYWAFVNENISIWVASDCTGHGVPGALMSMLGIGFLNEIVAEGGEENAAGILNKLRSKIIKSLQQKGEEQRKDGMDIALCVLDSNTNILQFSGAYNSLILIRKNETELIPSNFDKKIEDEQSVLYEFSGDKMPIGKHIKDANSFSITEVQLRKGDVIYTFTDGFQDQFGGVKGKKYMIKRMKSYLLSIQNESISRQKEMLDTEFENWIKEAKEKQIDDVCIVGVQI